MLTEKLYHRLLALSPPLIADARCVLGLEESHLDSGIRPVIPFTRMAGSAITVQIELAVDEDSADLNPMRQAFVDPPQGYPIMAMALPPKLHAYGSFGSGSATLARSQGFVGALIEGAVRDTPDLKEMQYPVFCRALSPGYLVGKASTGAVGTPVRVGGREIRQGDVIVADHDGVIINRRCELEAILDQAEKVQAWEKDLHKAYREGQNPADAEAPRSAPLTDPPA